MADDPTPVTVAPTPDLSGLSSDELSKLLASLHLGQGLPNIQPDTTPVDTSGFWGGLRHGISLLGEAAGSPGPETLKALSPAEREQAGFQSLSRFGTGLMAASHYVPGQTLGSNLAQGFQAAEHGYDQTARQAMGMLAAKQGYAVQSQQADLERLRAALPLLTLQSQLAGSGNTQRLLTSPNTSIGGDGTYVGAIGGHEGTGQNPNSSAVGVGQFLDSTWGDFIKENPQYFAGMTPEQAMAARKDPAFGAKVGPVAIEWLAKQNADALTKAGVPPSGPVLGIAHYLGAGAAANIAKAPDGAMVSSFVPAAAVAANPELKTMTVGQMKARYANTPNPSFMSAPSPAPGQAGTPTPANLAPSAPGAKTQIPPPTVAAPGMPTVAPTVAPAGRATLPPPEPPMAGTAQTAGPGVPTGTAIPPSPPGSPGTVASIISGMVGAGADPTTLAPGPGSAPAAQPGAVVTAQAGATTPTAPQMPPIKAGEGLIQHPGTYQEYRSREFVPPPATEDFNPNLSPARQAQFTALQQGIDQRITNLRNLPIAKQQEAGAALLEERAALQAKIQEETANKSQAAAANVTKYNETQDNAIRPRYEKEVDAYKAAAQSNLTSQQKIAEAQAQSGFDINKAGKQVGFETDKETLKSLAANAAVAATVNPQLEQLSTVTPGALPPGIAASIVRAHPNLTPFLTQVGAITPEQATDTQLMLGMTNMLSTELRPKGSGRLLLPEIDAFKSDLPNLLQEPGGRIKAAAFLKNLNDRSQEESDFANQHFKRPGPDGQPAYNLDGLAKAIAKPRSEGGLGPIVPPMPPLSAFGADPVGAVAGAKTWLKQNVEIGRPYMGWQLPKDKNNQPDPSRPPELHLMVREN